MCLRKIYSKFTDRPKCNRYYLAECAGFPALFKKTAKNIGRWYCPVCIINKQEAKLKLIDSSAVNETVAHINDETKANLKNLISEMLSTHRKEEISTSSTQASTSMPVESTDFVQNKHVVLIEDKEEERFAEDSWATVVKKKAAGKLKNIPIKKMILNSQGHGCIFFPSEQNKLDAVNMLQDDFIVTSSSKPSKKISPKLKICNLQNHNFDCKEEIKEAILRKKMNIQTCLESDDDSFFDVLFIAKDSMGKSLFAMVKVSLCITEVILKTKRIFIDLESHFVVDHFHVVQCFKCQGFGHKIGSKSCPLHDSNRSICLYCSGEHKSSLSTSKTNVNCQKCVSCKNSNNAEISLQAEGHTSTSKKCPTI